MKTDLTGRLALVTGASKGIGLASAQALAEAGARVIAVARGADALQRFVDEDPNLRTAWAVDVTDETFAERIEALDSLDILVNNAGTNKPQPVAEVDMAVFDAMLALNVRSVFRASQAAVRVMLRSQRRGAIVNLSSQMGHVGAENRSVYCATKHAVEGMTKAMAVELAPQGIRVNAVAPTFIETPMVRPMLDDPAFEDYVLRRIPLGRVGQVEDVANAVLYLASDASGLVTGHSLLVDGGWTAA